MKYRCQMHPSISVYRPRGTEEQQQWQKCRYGDKIRSSWKWAWLLSIKTTEISSGECASGRGFQIWHLKKNKWEALNYNVLLTQLKQSDSPQQTWGSLDAPSQPLSLASAWQQQPLSLRRHRHNFSWQMLPGMVFFFHPCFKINTLP